MQSGAEGRTPRQGGASGAGAGGLGRRESTADGEAAAADAELEAAVLDTLTDVVLTGAPRGGELRGFKKRCCGEHGVMCCCCGELGCRLG